MSKWEKVKLGDVCKIRYGKDHKKLASGNIPAYGSGGIMRYVDTAIHSKISVLIPRKGTLNNIFLIKQPFWTVDTIFWTDINIQKINPFFLYYILLTKNLAQHNVGTAVPSLTTAILNEIEIPLPPLEEQKRIAAILSSLDDKIEVNNQINKNLEEQAQAIFKSWFVDFEPFGGVMPNDWRIGAIKDYCKIKSGFAFKSSWWQDNGTPVVKIKNITTNGLNMEEHSCVPKDKETLAKDFIAKQGDVLIAMTGATIGKSCVVPKLENKMLINQRVGKFFLGDTPLEKLPYLWCILKQQKVFDEIVNKGQGSAQPNVSPSDIESIEIVYTDEYIEKFNLLLKSNFEKITENMFQNLKLTKLRNILLPKLMKDKC